MGLSEAIEAVKESYVIAKRLNEAKSKIAQLKIIEEIKPKNEPSGVYRYNLHEQRERILQLARS